MKKNVLRILLILLLFAIRVNAATYYLDANNGNDANDGSSIQEAWKTIARAYDTNGLNPNVAAGDLVLLRDGDYGVFELEDYIGSDWIEYRADTGHTPVFTSINIANSSRQDVYLRFDGIDVLVPDHDPWPDPNVYPSAGWYSISVEYCVRITNANYVELLNMTIRGDNKYLTYKGVTVSNSSYVTIDHCEITNIYRGILGGGRTGLTIKNSHIHHIVASGIYVTEGNDFTFENNHLHDSGYELSDDYLAPYRLYDIDDTYTGSPAFQNGETILQTTTEFTAKCIGVWFKNNYWKVYYVNPSGAFLAGYEVTGQSSGATITPSSVNNGLLPHGSGIAIAVPDDTSIGSIRGNIIHDGFISTGAITFYKEGYTDFIIENNLTYNAKSFALDNVRGPGLVRNNSVCNIGESTWQHDDVTSNWRVLAWYSAGGIRVTIKDGWEGDKTTIKVYNNLVTRSFGLIDGITMNNNHFWSGTVGEDSVVAVWGDNDDFHGYPNYWEDIGYRGSTPEYDYAVDGIVPFFEDPDANDWRVVSGNALINAGDASNQPTDSLGTLGEDGFIVDDGITRDASHHSIGAYEYNFNGGDTDPPTPNPAAWEVVPTALSTSSITMTATTASDASEPVQYRFLETTGNPGEASSDWRTNPIYTPTGLQANTLYTFTVQSRDSIPNTGTASSGASATTNEETNGYRGRYGNDLRAIYRSRYNFN